MKNSFGTNVIITLFGESHGPYIGAVLDGIAPGIKIDYDYINSKLKRRNPGLSFTTDRQEPDSFQIISGVKNDFTSGSPLTIIIPNQNTISADYNDISNLIRPGHADLTSEYKYHGYQDKNGGGHFSGRLTAAIVAVGAICEYALENKGINIITHIKKCMDISDNEFTDHVKDAKRINNNIIPVINEEIGKQIIGIINNAKEKLDSVGGTLETIITNMPIGVGEPWFDSIESIISHAVFSIPSVKGIEFGSGFDFTNMFGSQANDTPYIKNGLISHKTNNNGGVNGGISNGMPILFKTVIKPTPSIGLEQDTIDIKEYNNKKITINGRHDNAIFPRACEVINAISSIALCDLLSQRFGTDWLMK